MNETTPTIDSDEELVQKLMDSLQNVMIDPERVRQMSAYIKTVVMRPYIDFGGKEEGRNVKLASLLVDMAKVLYTAGFVDGFLDSTPRFMVQNKWPKLF